MTISRYVTVPNALTASRLVFLPLLYVFALSRMDVAFVITYALVGATDCFDGIVARRLHQRTAFGKTLDSIADLPFYLSSAFFMACLHMAYLKPNMVLLWVMFGFLGLSFVVSAIRCGKPILMHTFLLKLVAVLVYFAVILSSFVDTTIFVTVILAIYILGFIEEILIWLVHGEVDPDSPTVFQVRPKPKRTELKPALPDCLPAQPLNRTGGTTGSFASTNRDVEAREALQAVLQRHRRRDLRRSAGRRSG